MAMLWKDPGWDQALLCLGPPSTPKTIPITPLKAVSLWLHTCPWQEGFPCRLGVSEHSQRGGMGLMGWVQVRDESGHTAPLWHRAHKNWIPSCSSPLPRDSVSPHCCSKAHEWGDLDSSI